MAKALKIGEQVTVKKPIKFAAQSPEYSSGLQRIRRGDIGIVVGTGEGRSMRVQFKGVQTMLTVQSLVRPDEVQNKQHKQAKATRSATILNYNSRDFIREVANKLLIGGDAANQQSVTIEINLKELPDEIQDQIKSLIRAKLDLDAPSASQSSTDQPRRKRGRPAGVKNKLAAPGKKRGPKPKQAKGDSETQS